MSTKKHATNRHETGIAIGHPGLGNKIAKAIYDRWPKFPTQREVASNLNVPQSLVSKSLSRWTSKNNVPLKVFYDERNIELEKRLRNGIKRPYFLLVVGGGSQKSLPLKQY